MLEAKEVANFVSGNLAADLTTTTPTEVIVAQGAGVKVYLKTAVITNSSATATRVDIKDGTTVKASVHVGATGGRIQIVFDPPLAGTANTAWNVECGTAAAAVRAFLSGVKARR